MDVVVMTYISNINTWECLSVHYGEKNPKKSALPQTIKNAHAKCEVNLQHTYSTDRYLWN